MGDTYIVTGGAGFIGSHLAARLVQDGHTVRVIDNLLTGTHKNIAHVESLGGDYTFHEVSITDLDAIRPIFEGADYVFHQAALPSVPRSVDDPIETNLHCVNGTLNVLVAARDGGVKRVVQAASSSAYGDVEGDYKSEEMAPRPKSPYGVAKLAGEYYAQAFTEVYGLETVSLRYFNVFGPRQDPTSHYAAVIPKFITLMLNGEQPVIYGDGSHSRDFTFIDNVVHGNLLAAKAPDAAGHMMNLATGGRVTLLDLMKKLNDILKTSIQPLHDPPREGDILHSRASIEKAATLLDYMPIVDFDEGLRRTVAFYREQVSTP